MTKTKRNSILCCFPSADTHQDEEKSEQTDMMAPRNQLHYKINEKMYNDLQEMNRHMHKMTEDHNDQLRRLEEEKQKLESKHKISELDTNQMDERRELGYSEISWLIISEQLQGIAGLISNLSSSMQDSFNPQKLPKEKIVEFFKKCWTDDLGYNDARRKKTIKSVEDLFRDVPIGKIYKVVIVLFEKLMSDILVSKVYLSSIHVGFDNYNNAVDTIQDLIKIRGDKFGEKLRVITSSSLSDLIQENKPMKDQKLEHRKALIAEICNRLAEIYESEVLKKKVGKTVLKAINLSFPLHSQFYKIVIHNLEADEDLFTNEVDIHQLSTSSNPNKVLLGIYPVIYTSEPSYEDDEDNTEDDTSRKETNKIMQKEGENIGHYRRNVFVYSGKAIGYEQR